MCQTLPDPETCLTCTEACNRRFPLLNANRALRACVICGTVMIVRPNSPRQCCSRQCYYRATHIPRWKWRRINGSNEKRWTSEMVERWNAVMTTGAGWNKLRKLMLG